MDFKKIPPSKNGFIVFLVDFLFIIAVIAVLLILLGNRGMLTSIMDAFKKSF